MQQPTYTGVYRSLDTRVALAEDTSSRVCYIARGLLQLSPGLVADDDHWWAAAGIECRSTSDLWLRQVTIEVCHGCSAMNCTGLTFLSGCSTSLPWPFTDVSGLEHRRTLPITAFPSLKSPVR